MQKFIAKLFSTITRNLIGKFVETQWVVKTVAFAFCPLLFYSICIWQ